MCDAGVAASGVGGASMGSYPAAWNGPLTCSCRSAAVCVMWLLPLHLVLALVTAAAQCGPASRAALERRLLVFMHGLWLL
jgi:hypothetical protein